MNDNRPGLAAEVIDACNLLEAAGEGRWSEALDLGRRLAADGRWDGVRSRMGRMAVPSETPVLAKLDLLMKGAKLAA